MGEGGGLGPLFLNFLDLPLGNLIVSTVTSVSFKDARSGWNSSRKRTMTYIVMKSGQRHKKWKVKWRKVCNILKLSLGISWVSRNDRNSPFCFVIALEALWMTVHAANTETKLIASDSLAFSSEGLYPKLLWGHLPSPFSGESAIESPCRRIALMG